MSFLYQQGCVFSFQPCFVAHADPIRVTTFVRFFLFTGFAASCVLACLALRQALQFALPSPCPVLLCSFSPLQVLYILTSSYHSTSDFRQQIETFVNTNLTDVASRGDAAALIARIHLVDTVSQVRPRDTFPLALVSASWYDIRLQMTRL